ncbi:MAG: hypothetical protein KAG97_08150, partial [Victivallales bacterium]|nr:hypothetical protein [Victivallales bacterium]
MDPFATLGYSLADEPSGSGLVEFRNWATTIIDAKDGGAKVGFCGMWMGVGKDVPKIMNACDYIVAYSPHYLYTSNLWLGIERDLFRSFVKKDTIYSAWTNYVPHEDCEPYSRTMPWLMLFEGGNGVSYFDSGGAFAILGADLRPSHEARWFSSEIHEINRGIGRQLIGMRRKVGSVRILFGTDVPQRLVKRLQVQTELWVKILNERNIPYKFISRAELPNLNVSTVKLLLSPATPTLSVKELKYVAKFAKSGGVVMAMPPFGLISNLPKKQISPFWIAGREGPLKKKPIAKNLSYEINTLSGLFGFKRLTTGKAPAIEIVGEVTKRCGVPIEIAWNAKFADETGLKPQTVPSGGAPSLKMTTGEILAEFQWDNKGKTPPEYVSAILATPAM